MYTHHVNDVQQPFFVRLPPTLARRVRAVLDVEPPSFMDFNEFVVAALENQLQLLAGGAPADAEKPPPTRPTNTPAHELDVLRPLATTDVETVEASTPKNAMFMLTNRMNPFPIPLRVLVNMTVATGPPSVDAFAAAASEAARSVGLDLQRRDALVGPGPRGRRAVGWPVGEEAWKSRDRFTASFLLRQTQKGQVGPLLDLGLCDVRGDLVFPTERGLALAELPNPLLGEVAGEGLSEQQQELLRGALRHNYPEFAEICLFTEALSLARGDVTTADTVLARVHADWNAAQISAHRSAMVGRLVDVSILEIWGRGRTAKATLAPAGEMFIASQQQTEPGEAS